MKHIRQVRKGRRAEEEQGGYVCGMCDEQGHESGAGETMQNNNLHTLTAPISPHFTTELWKCGGQRHANSYTCLSRLGISIEVPVSFVLGRPVEVYTMRNCVAGRLGLMNTLCFLCAAPSLCSCRVQLKVWACTSAEGRLVEMCWRVINWLQKYYTSCTKKTKRDGRSNDAIWGSSICRKWKYISHTIYATS